MSIRNGRHGGSGTTLHQHPRNVLPRRGVDTYLLDGLLARLGLEPIFKQKTTTCYEHWSFPCCAEESNRLLIVSCVTPPFCRWPRNSLDTRQTAGCSELKCRRVDCRKTGRSRENRTIEQSSILCRIRRRKTSSSIHRNPSTTTSRTIPMQL